nr:MAG TPA: hypothetical protein [Siphoviridae sp. cta6m1]
MTALRCIERRTPAAMFFKKTGIFLLAGSIPVALKSR